MRFPPVFAHSYITLFGSLLSVAWHLAFRLNQQCSALVIDSLRNTRFACIIFGHWILHAYGLLSLSNFRLHPFLIPILVPLPSLFYVFTAKYTDPSNFGH